MARHRPATLHWSPPVPSWRSKTALRCRASSMANSPPAYRPTPARRRCATGGEGGIVIARSNPAFSSFRDAPSGAGPESITAIVSMDSGQPRAAASGMTRFNCGQPFRHSSSFRGSRSNFSSFRGSRSESPESITAIVSMDSGQPRAAASGMTVFVSSFRGSRSESPESISRHAARRHGFRARSFRSRPGMTMRTRLDRFAVCRQSDHGALTPRQRP
jgi:hypothetical protein